MQRAMISTSPLHHVLRFLLWAFCALVLLFLVTPILVVLPLSFNVEPYFSYPMPGTSLRWYRAVFQSPAWRNALSNSLVIGLLTMVFSTFLGALAALGLTRARFPFKTLILGTLISPMVSPIVITAVAMYFFYAKIGLINSLARWERDRVRNTAKTRTGNDSARPVLTGSSKIRW